MIKSKLPNKINLLFFLALLNGFLQASSPITPAEQFALDSKLIIEIKQLIMFPARPSQAQVDAAIVNVKRLLNDGANVNCQAGVITLLHAACFKDYPELVRTLLDFGAIVNLSIDKYCTPLMSASMFGNTEVVKLLLAAGAMVDQFNENDQTALMIACEQDHPLIVQLLIDYGANQNHRDINGKTALDAAKKGLSVYIEKALYADPTKYQKVLEILEEDARWHGANRMRSAWLGAVNAIVTS